MGQQGFLASMTMDRDFPGKASHCNTFSISLSSLKRETLKRAKQPKAKEQMRDINNIK